MAKKPKEKATRYRAWREVKKGEQRERGAQEEKK
jgi:hypothetical protein